VGGASGARWSEDQPARVLHLLQRDLDLAGPGRRQLIPDLCVWGGGGGNSRRRDEGDAHTHTILHTLDTHSVVISFLTLSTSSNTRRKLCRRTSANSLSVQFLRSSSWIRAGYLDTSSRPRGKLSTGRTGGALDRESL